MDQGLGMRCHKVTFKFPWLLGDLSLRVQVPNNHILTQNLYYNYYYPNPKYLIIGYMDPLGMVFRVWGFGVYQDLGMERQTVGARTIAMLKVCHAKGPKATAAPAQATVAPNAKLYCADSG